MAAVKIGALLPINMVGGGGFGGGGLGGGGLGEGAWGFGGGEPDLSFLLKGPGSESARFHVNWWEGSRKWAILVNENGPIPGDAF